MIDLSQVIFVLSTNQEVCVRTWLCSPVIGPNFACTMLHLRHFLATRQWRREVRVHQRTSTGGITLSISGIFDGEHTGLASLCVSFILYVSFVDLGFWSSSFVLFTDTRFSIHLQASSSPAFSCTAPSTSLLSLLLRAPNTPSTSLLSFLDEAARLEAGGDPLPTTLKRISVASEEKILADFTKPTSFSLGALELVVCGLGGVARQP